MEYVSKCVSVSVHIHFIYIVVFCVLYVVHTMQLINSISPCCVNLVCDLDHFCIGWMGLN